MKKQTPFLDFYKEYISFGKLPSEGLCNCRLPKTLKKFKPSDAEKMQLREDGMPSGFWAHGYLYTEDFEYDDFTPLRQTIILFCAAINGEL